MQHPVVCDAVDSRRTQRSDVMDSRIAAHSGLCRSGFLCADLASDGLANACIRFRIFFSSVGPLWSSVKMFRPRESRDRLVPSLLTYSLRFLFLVSLRGWCLPGDSAPCPQGDGHPEPHLCLWCQLRVRGLVCVSRLLLWN